MTQDNIKAILAIAIHAAFADSNKDDREREEIRRIAESLAEQGAAPDLTRLYQDVLLKRLPLAAATTQLVDAGERQLAYEMALCVCETDGRLIESERRFLDELKRLLGLTATETELIDGEVDLIAAHAASAVPLVAGQGDQHLAHGCRLVVAALPFEHPGQQQGDVLVGRVGLENRAGLAFGQRQRRPQVVRPRQVLTRIGVARLSLEHLLEALHRRAVVAGVEGEQGRLPVVQGDVGRGGHLSHSFQPNSRATAARFSNRWAL